LELDISAWGQKLEWGYRVEKVLRISSAMWIQYTNATDGHRTTAKTVLMHSVVR